jgi:hypothetical protein
MMRCKHGQCKQCADGHDQQQLQHLAQQRHSSAESVQLLHHHGYLSGTDGMSSGRHACPLPQRSRRRWSSWQAL